MKVLNLLYKPVIKNSLIGAIFIFLSKKFVDKVYNFTTQQEIKRIKNFNYKEPLIYSIGTTLGMIFLNLLKIIPIVNRYYKYHPHLFNVNDEMFQNISNEYRNLNNTFADHKEEIINSYNQNIKMSSERKIKREDLQKKLQLLTNKYKEYPEQIKGLKEKFELSFKQFEKDNVEYKKFKKQQDEKSIHLSYLDKESNHKLIKLSKKNYEYERENELREKSEQSRKQYLKDKSEYEQNKEQCNLYFSQCYKLKSSILSLEHFPTNHLTISKPQEILYDDLKYFFILKERLSKLKMIINPNNYIFNYTVNGFISSVKKPDNILANESLKYTIDYIFSNMDFALSSDEKTKLRHAIDNARKDQNDNFNPEVKILLEEINGILKQAKSNTNYFTNLVLAYYVRTNLLSNNGPQHNL